MVPSSLVPLEKQIQALDLKINIHLNKIKNLAKEPDSPYWIVCQDGKINLGRSPQNCRENLDLNERGLTLTEGLALYLHYPEAVKDHSVDLLGSTYGNECTPTIYFWGDRVRISAICSDVSDSMCGSATCLK